MTGTGSYCTPGPTPLFVLVTERSLPIPIGQMAPQLETTFACFPGSHVWPDDQLLANEMWAEVIYTTSKFFFFFLQKAAYCPIYLSPLLLAEGLAVTDQEMEVTC